MADLLLTTTRSKRSRHWAWHLEGRAGGERITVVHITGHLGLAVTADRLFMLQLLLPGLKQSLHALSQVLSTGVSLQPIRRSGSGQTTRCWVWHCPWCQFVHVALTRPAFLAAGGVVEASPDLKGRHWPMKTPRCGEGVGAR